MGLFNRKKIQPNDKIGETNELTDEELDQLVVKGSPALEEMERHAILQSELYEFRKQEQVETMNKAKSYLTDQDWTYINTKARDENHRELLINELAQLRYNEYIESLENQKGKSR